MVTGRRQERRRARIRGQSMTEYAIVCAALALALGLSMRDGSPLKAFFDGVAEGYQKFSYAISLVL